MGRSILILIINLLVVIDLKAQVNLAKAVEIIDLYSDIEEGLDHLSKVKVMVDSITKGSKPNVPDYGTGWATLAKNYRTAADKLKIAKLVTDIDTSKFSVSIEEMNDCKLKKMNFEKLRGFKEQLDDATEKGKSDLYWIDKYRTEIDSTRTILKYLIEVNADLTKVPIYNEIFQWNWFELETSVTDALNDLSSGLNLRENQLKKEIDKRSSESSNLESNIKLLEGKICDYSGVYKGEMSGVLVGDIVCILTIKQNAGNYSARFSQSYPSQDKVFNYNIDLLKINDDKRFEFEIYRKAYDQAFVDEGKIKIQCMISDDLTRIDFFTPGYSSMSAYRQ